ncbi:hypothetical protein ACHAWX_000242 [Stephanocyclus meneghinianus]
MKLPDLSPFKKCLMFRLFMHHFIEQPTLALVFCKHHTRICQILKEWAPKWGNIGEALSCLDITADYLYTESPDKTIDLGRPKQVYIDRTDWDIVAKQKDAAIAKSMYSPKTDDDAVKGLTFLYAA